MDEVNVADYSQSAVEAAKLLARRKLVRTNLIEWARVCGFEPAAHHRLICEKLTDVVNGKTKRLMIFVPPGSAKSTYASVIFPPWFLAQRPRSTILACSHSADLAESFGRKCRDKIGSHGKELGYSLSKTSQAAGQWATTTECEYYSAGVGGAIAGRRADLALIDDPVRNKEDADSKLIRDKQKSWYDFDLLTRLKPGAAVILIMTRWHEDDLAGQLLKDPEENWEVIRLPMLAEDNDPLGRSKDEPLWPEWFDEGTLKNARKDPRAYNSLWQQNPTPESGEFFSKEWVQGYSPEQLPRDLVMYGAGDFACSEESDANKTCLPIGGMDESGNLWILPDIFWQQGNTGVVVDGWFALDKKHKPLKWFAEKGHISKSIGPFMRSRMQEEQHYFAIEEVTPSRNKQQRAKSLQGMMSCKKVFFPTFASWWPAALHEMMSFPVGKSDDLVDALAHLGNGVNKMYGAEPPREEGKEVPNPTGIHITMQQLKDSVGYMKRKKVLELADR